MKFFAMQKKNGRLVMINEVVDIEDGLGRSYNGILVADKKTLREILREHFDDNKNLKIIGIEVSIIIELQEEYVHLLLIQDGRDGNEQFYAPLSVLEEFAKRLLNQDENEDAQGWFRKLITWEGSPTKKCPVVGVGSKGAKGFSQVKRSIELNLQDHYSVEEFTDEFTDEEEE